MRGPTIILTILLAITQSYSVTIQVPVNQPTIQAGIDAAVNGDTVLVAGGTYTGEGNATLRFDGKAIVVRAEYGPEHTVIDGRDSSGAILFTVGEDSSTVFEGFSVQDFYMNGYGLIRCDTGSSPTIKNCTFERIVNQGGQIFGGTGGAMYLDSASPTIRDCRFFDNETGNTPTWGQWAGGSGMFCRFSSPFISNCIFANNAIVGDGRGSALRCEGSAPDLRNCTFSGNLHDEQIYLVDSDPTFENCILAFGEGQAVSCTDTLSQPELICSDVFGNGSGNRVGCISGQEAQGGNLEVDPLFCNTAAEWFGLQKGSPCLPENSLCAALFGAIGVQCVCCTLRGHVDDDDRLSDADITAFVSYSFKGGPAPRASRKPTATATYRPMSPTSRISRPTCSRTVRRQWRVHSRPVILPPPVRPRTS